MQSFSQIITTNKPTPNFLQAGCPSCRPTNNVKSLKGKFFSNFLKTLLTIFLSICGMIIHIFVVAVCPMRRLVTRKWAVTLVCQLPRDSCRWSKRSKSKVTRPQKKVKSKMHNSCWADGSTIQKVKRKGHEVSVSYMQQIHVLYMVRLLDYDCCLRELTDYLPYR